MNEIEFSIGPGCKESHDKILEWLNLNSYDIRSISFNGDHFSEIYVKGDYNKIYNHFQSSASFEHWE